MFTPVEGGRAGVRVRYQVGSRRVELRPLVTVVESCHPSHGLALSFDTGASTMSESAVLRGSRAKVCDPPGSGLELFGCLCSFCLSLVPS